MNEARGAPVRVRKPHERWDGRGDCQAGGRRRRNEPSRPSPRHRPGRRAPFHSCRGMFADGTIPLSRAIKELEAELQVWLSERNPQGTRYMGHGKRTRRTCDALLAVDQATAVTQKSGVLELSFVTDRGKTPPGNRFGTSTLTPRGVVDCTEAIYSVCRSLSSTAFSKLPRS